MMFGIFDLSSSYSLLKSTIPLESLILAAKDQGYDFVALSDEHLYGLATLFNEADKKGIKPVLGLRLVVEDEMSDTPFLVYVKNQTGYHNLLKLVLEKEDVKLTLEKLVEYQDGLMFITAGYDSKIDQLILDNNQEEAYRYLMRYKKHLHSLFIGLSLDRFDLEMKVAPHLYELSEKTGIAMLPLHQTRYMNKEDKVTYDSLRKIDNLQYEIQEESYYHFMSKEDLLKRFSDYPFVFDTAAKVMNDIIFRFNPPHFEMPMYHVKGGNPERYLKSLAILGLKKRLTKIKNADEKVYQERLLYELSVIHRMGFDSYFLIVYDFVRYAKTNGILVGPGRGSSAGSLVAYCLGITDVDPITYDLLFERFLNPERVSMPDIDMDFPDNRRDDVIRYVAQTYGKEHIASIVTFGTFAIRSSIRDIARVMNIDQARAKGIIQRVIDNNIDETDFEMMQLLKVAKTIEGLPRHTGTHAAGIILSKQDLTQWIPMQKGLFDFYQTQLEAKHLEAMGLLKIDFLGIRNLSIIDDVVKQIERLDKKIDLSDLPFDDKKTYELLAKAETTGIFQLESMGMRAALRKLQPNQFEDIVALLALYRPGPMDHIDTYIERRNGKPFTYEHPDLQTILKSTYGIIIYQEQIMRIAHEFAGYTLAEADLLRRGISKKDRDYMENERIRFIKKCQKMGHDDILSKGIYDLIVKFADYGFNRSHSVAYAMVAYQMAYLKANYFPIFMSVLMSSVVGNDELTTNYVVEVKKQGIQIFPPDVQKSTDKYTYENGVIRMPILAIKGIGLSTYTKFDEERKNGRFIDYLDFKKRVNKLFSERIIESFIHAGALDSFNLNRHTMMLNKSIEFAGYEKFIDDFVMQKAEELPFSELSQLEKDALGFNLVYHPLMAYAEEIKKQKLNSLEIFKTANEAEVIAYIKKIKTIQTKQGKPMAFIELDDGVSQMEATLFSDVYKRYLNCLTNDVQVFKMRVNEFRNEKTFVVVSIRKL